MKMAFNDLEKKVAEINATLYKEICVWYKVLNNPTSSTRYHTHPSHKLYPCVFGCNGLEKQKDCYKNYLK